jgi:hypothetical protein
MVANFGDTNLPEIKSVSLAVDRSKAKEFRVTATLVARVRINPIVDFDIQLTAESNSGPLVAPCTLLPMGRGVGGLRTVEPYPTPGNYSSAIVLVSRVPDSNGFLDTYSYTRTYNMNDTRFYPESSPDWCSGVIKLGSNRDYPLLIVQDLAGHMLRIQQSSLRVDPVMFSSMWEPPVGASAPCPRVGYDSDFKNVYEPCNQSYFWKDNISVAIGLFKAQGVLPNASPSPAPTATVTASPSPAPTVTVTASPSPAPTVTVTASPSPAPTVTITASPSTDLVKVFSQVQSLSGQLATLRAKLQKICANRPKPKGC